MPWREVTRRRPLAVWIFDIVHCGAESFPSIPRQWARTFEIISVSLSLRIEQYMASSKWPEEMTGWGVTHSEGYKSELRPLHARANLDSFAPEVQRVGSRF